MFQKSDHTSSFTWMVVLCSEDDEDDEEDEDDDDEEDECAMMGGTGEVIMCDDIWCSLWAWRWSVQGDGL